MKKRRTDAPGFFRMLVSPKDYARLEPLINYGHTIGPVTSGPIYGVPDVEPPSTEADRWPRVIRRWAQKHAGERR